MSFDYSFIKTNAAAEGFPFEKSGIDTLKIAQKVHKDLESRSLEYLCHYYHIENRSAHRAYHDALATAKLYQTLAHYFEAENPRIFSPVQLNYKIKKPRPATAKQIAFLTSHARKKKVCADWDPDTLTLSGASRLIEMMLKQ